MKTFITVLVFICCAFMIFVSLFLIRIMWEVMHIAPSGNGTYFQKTQI